MTAREALIEEIKRTPETILPEVEHYLRYLRDRTETEGFDGLSLSESALAADWLSPEEDEAWKDL